MKEKKIARGIRKHIRREKARIRKEATSKEEEVARLSDLLSKFRLKSSNKDNSNL